MLAGWRRTFRPAPLGAPSRLRRAIVRQASGDTDEFLRQSHPCLSSSW
jgi:hypothetical protein